MKYPMHMLGAGKKQFSWLLLVLGMVTSIATAAYRVHFLIPGGAGGGWDTTARGVGKALARSGPFASSSCENMSGPLTVIGIFLDTMAESNLIYSCRISGAQWSYLLEHPITTAIIIPPMVSSFGGKPVHIQTSRVIAQANA